MLLLSPACDASVPAAVPALVSVPAAAVVLVPVSAAAPAPHSVAAPNSLYNSSSSSLCGFINLLYRTAVLVEALQSPCLLPPGHLPEVLQLPRFSHLDSLSLLVGNIMCAIKICK